MLRDAGVRGKLFAVLAIPMLLLVLSTGWLVGGQVQSARQAGQIEAVTDVALQLNRVVHSLQLERTVTLSFIEAPAAGGDGLHVQRSYTDSQLRILSAKIAASPIAEMSSRIRSAAAQSAQAQAKLATARKAIDAGKLDAVAADTFYAETIADNLQLPGVIAASASPALAQRLQAEQALSMTIEYASHERDLIELAFLQGTVSQAEFGQASALLAQQTQSLQDFERSAPSQLFAGLSKNLDTANTAQLYLSHRQLTGLLRGVHPDHPGSVAWLNAANPRIASMVTAEIQLVGDIAGVATDLQRSEQLKAGLFGAGGIFGLVLAMLLAAVLAQRITRPLRRLTVAAGEIGEELPRMVERMQTPGEGPGVLVDPIPVESGDEIGRLAEAFNTVNEVTLRVAQEQAALRASIAEMFVNVARRNQVLLGRQLAQLDKMEAREEDPDLLTNLFRLDHLATRMRRNAESLLVLAGIDSTRRLRQALPLSDVIRTAVGEIEAYERVDLSIADDPAVSGRHALSIAHLLAELLENATHFSNPGTRVVVSTAMTGHGVDVTITDYGLGMNDDEIEQANENIEHPPVAEIAVSQRLGLFVVGRIAAHLGATASLRKGRSAGTVVTVGLPLAVFEGMKVDEPATDYPATAATGLVAHDSRSTVDVADEAAHVADVAMADALVAADTAVPVPAAFNPAQVALSRVPQIDVGALVADAAADSRSNTLAAPVPAEATGRGLLPRRSRSDAPVDPIDPVDPIEVAPVAVAPVEVATADVVDEQPVVEDFVPDTDAGASDVEVSDVEVSDVEVSDVEVSDAAGIESSDTESSDSELPEIAASATRRGSFFQRRRPAAVEVPEPVEASEAVEAPDDVAVEPIVEPLVVEDVDPADFFDRPLVDGPLVVDDEVEVDAQAELEAVSDVVADDQLEPETAAQTSVEPAVASRPRRRFGRRGGVERAVEPSSHDVPDDHEGVDESDGSAVELSLAAPELGPDGAVFETAAEELTAEEPVAAELVTDELVTDESLEAVATEKPARRGLFARRPRSTEPDAVEATVVDEAADWADESVLYAPVVRVPEKSTWPVFEDSVESQPLIEEPVETLAEDADTELFAVVEAVDEVSAQSEVEPDVTDEPTRRRGLFGRRTRDNAEPVAAEADAEPVAEPVADDAVFVPVADDAVFVPVAEAPEPIAEPVAEPVAESFTWPVDDDAVVAAPIAAEAIETLAEVGEADQAVVDEQVEVVEEPTRRRGLFSRRARSGVEAAAADESVAEPAATEFAFTPGADAPVPDPRTAPTPEPQPAAAYYSAPAIDILPGRPMGGRGKHAAAAPAPVPVPAEPIAAPHVPVFAVEPISSVPVVPAVVPPAPREFASVAPSAPPRQASEAAPMPSRFPVEQRTVEQPHDDASELASGLVMSELDQLSHNAQLQQSALSELRGLYEPAVNQGAARLAAAPAGLVRRERRAVPAETETEPVPDVPARTRDAAEVRGMLSGFRAGVDRGRSVQAVAPITDAPRTDTATTDTATTKSDATDSNPPDTDPVNTGSTAATDDSTG